MMGNQEPRGSTFPHRQRQQQLVTVLGRCRPHLDQAAVVAVNPAAAARRHLERGWHVEQLPDAVQLHEDALAMAQTRVPQLVVVAVDSAEALSLVGRLREEAPTRELPVVAVGDRSRREEALRAGVDEFIEIGRAHV